MRNMYDEDVAEAVVLAIHNRRQRVLAAALAVLPREASAEGARKFRVPPPPSPILCTASQFLCQKFADAKY